MTIYYVSKSGNDGSPGTFRQPKLTIADGLRHLDNEDILYVLSGTYEEDFAFTNRVRNDHSVWLKTPKVIAYPGNTVILASNTTLESRTLAYFSMQGLHAIQDPANYAGVTFMDIANRRYDDEPIVHAFAFSVGGPDYVRNAPADLVRPVVTITSHVHMEEVYGSIDLTATATDNVAVDTTWLKIDGQTVHSEEPEDECAFTWDTTLSLNGEHVVQVFAKDTSGNVAVSPPITLVVDNVPPIEVPDSSLLVPSITVTCPNGEEKWKAGVDLSLTWESMCIEGNLNIFLILDGLPHQIFENIPNNGTIPWTVEGNRTPHCVIKIQSINNPLVVGISEEFDIV